MRRLTPVLLAAVALTTSGCIGISGTTSSQPAPLGSVVLTTSLCADGRAGCSATSNHGPANTLDAEPAVQVLFAVRLPEGTTPPATLTATRNGSGTGAATLTLTRSDSYGQQLQALEPAPGGERWWGWVSDVVAYSQDAKAGLTVAVKTALPRPADGGPAASPLRWRPVAGVRIVDGSLTAARAVACGPDLYTAHAEGSGNNDTIICVDSPDASATRGYLTAPITDLGVTGTGATAAPGATVPVAFSLERSGAAAPTVIALSATGGPAGATVTLDRESASLDSAAQDVTATVAVPAGAAPGTYPLTLTATAPDGEVRTGTAPVVVAPAATASATPTATPAVTAVPTAEPDVTAPRLTAARLVKRRALRVSVSEPARLTIALTRRGRRARTVTRSVAAGRVTVALPVRRLARGRYAVRAVAVDAAGNHSKATRRLKLQR